MNQNSKLSTFYSVLGRTLGLVLVGAEAFQQSQLTGGMSLLQPQNLATLIQETEMVLMGTPAPAVPTSPQTSNQKKNQ